MKDSHQITGRQLTALAFAAALCPLMHVLPGSCATLAGRAAWLCFLPAAPVLLAYTTFLNSFMRNAQPGESMAQLFLRCLGPVAGRAALGLFGLWFLFYAGFLLYRSGDRLVSTTYPGAHPAYFSTALLLLCLLAALGTIRGAARTAVLLRAIMLAALILILLFSVQNVDVRNLLPVTSADALPILRGCWPLIYVGGTIAYFCFLGGYVQTPFRFQRTLWLWAGVLLALGSAICTAVTGTFGAKLTAALRYPFFVMIRDIRFFHLAERIEAAIIAMWVFADFLLCTALLRCAFEAFRTLFGLPDPEGRPVFCLEGGRWLFLAEAAAVWAVSLLFTPDNEALERWSRLWIPIASCGMAFAAIPLVWAVGKLRRKL